MSIKTGGEPAAFPIFLILSLLVHLGIWGALRFFPSELMHQKKEASQPIPIEIIPAQPAPEKKTDKEKKDDFSRPLAKGEIIIPKDYIKTPSADPNNIAPFKRPSRILSNRNQSVLKETVPEKEPLKKGALTSEKTTDGQKTETGNLPSGKGLSGKTEGQPISKGEGLKTVTEPLTGKDLSAKQDIGKADNFPSTAPKILKEGTKRPNLFPSDERIAELNKEYEANPPKGEIGKKLQLNTSEFRFKGYAEVLARKLDLYWEYPTIAIRNNWKGGGTIIFRINQDGTLSDFRFLKLSGYPALDDAILTALKLSTPFPPFPKEIDLPYFEFTVYFEYL